MKNETCIHGGIAPIKTLKELPESQAGAGRHKCPTCAYETGYSLGCSKQWNSYDQYLSSIEDIYELVTCNNKSTVPTKILSELGENQGGLGRHKCCNCAFKEGFEEGMSEIKTKGTVLILSTPPKKVDKPKRKSTTVTNIDYIERELKNSKLGYLGEKAVIENEIKYLRENGKPDLAKKIVHVSEKIGNGLGYDILSFDKDGNEKKIEVKTTRGNKKRPFYITQNELYVSKKEASTYFLYRLFNFDSKNNTTSYYVIKGDLKNSLDLDPITYLAYPKI